VSGLGFISGWKCGANNITVRLDGGGPIPLATDQPRADTRLACGTVNNGFITQVNWNHLGAGRHTAVAYDNGVEFARSTFTVGTTGEEWLEDVTVSIDVPNFPAPGETGRFVWNESTQHLELAQVEEAHVPPEPPEPIPPAPAVALYWTSYMGSGTGRIQRSTLTGTQVTTILSENTTGGRGPTESHLMLDQGTGTLYWAAKGAIHRLRPDRTIETVVARIERAGFALDPVGRKLYWADEGAILWANLDGSQLATFLPADPSLPHISRPLLVAAGRALYWIDFIAGGGPDSPRMQRANLDGSQVTTLFTMSEASYWDVEAFAVDVANGKFYWIDGSLYRANLDDGSHVERLVPRIGDGTGLALDLGGGKMYWTLWLPYKPYTYGVYRANLDGSQVEALVTGVDCHGLALARD